MLQGAEHKSNQTLGTKLGRLTLVMTSAGERGRLYESRKKLEDYEGLLGYIN